MQTREPPLPPPAQVPQRETRPSGFISFNGRQPPRPTRVELAERYRQKPEASSSRLTSWSRAQTPPISRPPRTCSPISGRWTAGRRRTRCRSVEADTSTASPYEGSHTGCKQIHVVFLDTPPSATLNPVWKTGLAQPAPVYLASPNTPAIRTGMDAVPLRGSEKSARVCAEENKIGTGRVSR